MFKKTIKGLKDVWCGSLEFDTTPKAGSLNPVTSDGVKEAISEAVADIPSIEAAIPEGAGEEDQLVKSSELNTVDGRLESVESKIPSSASSTDKLVTKSELDNATASMESGYTPKGPASVSTLNGLTGQENGDQYIVTDSGTLTDGSIAVTAGESVAWDSTNDVWYKVNQYALKSVMDDVVHDFFPFTAASGYMSDDGTITAASGYHCLSTKKITASSGDVFFYHGIGSDSAYSVVFFTLAGSVISAAQYDSRDSYKVVTCPAGTASVIFSSYAADDTDIVFGIYKKHTQLDDLIQEVLEHTQRIEQNTGVLGATVKTLDNLVAYDDVIGDFTLVEDKWIGTNSTYDEAVRESTSWDYYYLDNVSENDVYLITSYCGQNGRLWYLFDADGNRLAMSMNSSNQSEKTESVRIVRGAYRLCVNRNKLYGAGYSTTISKRSSDIKLAAPSSVNLDKDYVSVSRDGKLQNVPLLRNLDLQEKLIDFVPSFTAVDHAWLSFSAGTTYDTMLSADSRWCVYYFDNIKEGDRFDITSYCGQNARLCYLFDADGNRIYADPQGSANSEKSAQLVIPPKAKRLAINSYKDQSSVLSIRKLYLSIPYELVRGESSSVNLDKDYVSVSRDGKLRNIPLLRNLDLQEKLIDSISSFTVVDRKLLSLAAGTTYDSMLVGDSRWCVYYFDNIKEGDRFDITSYCGQNARLCYLFDADGNRIYADPQGSANSEKSAQLVIPPKAKRLAINSYKDQSSVLSIRKLYLSIPYELVRDAPNGSNNSLYGKTLVCCGDSITYGADMDAEGILNAPGITMYQRGGNEQFSQVVGQTLASYGYQIASRNSMTFYNDGISGSTVEDITDKHGFSKANGRYTTLPDTIDYLTIFFGWNDNAYGTLGTISDNTNTTYYGSYNIVLDYLIDKYPYTKICLVVPFGCTADMRQAVRNLANKYGLSVFDMYGAGTPLYYGKEDSVGVKQSIVTANRAKFQANGAHPNFKGHRQIADMLEAHLRTI